MGNSVEENTREPEYYLKKIRKAQRVSEYERAVWELVGSCEITTENGFGRRGYRMK